MKNGKPDAVIIDIDNTVISCDARRAALCSVILGRPVSEDEIRHDLYCSRILDPESQKEYFKDFLSTKLMFMDKPYPDAARTIDTLRELGVTIVYLSGRFHKPVDKGRITVEYMRSYGLYKGEDIAIFKPSVDVYDTVFKQEALDALKLNYNILWAIDDTPHILRIYKQSGIFSIGITTSYSPRRFDFADMVVDGWDDMARLLENGILLKPMV